MGKIVMALIMHVRVERHVWLNVVCVISYIHVHPANRHGILHEVAFDVKDHFTNY